MVRVEQRAYGRRKPSRTPCMGQGNDMPISGHNRGTANGRAWAWVGCLDYAKMMHGKDLVIDVTWEVSFQGFAEHQITIEI